MKKYEKNLVSIIAPCFNGESYLRVFFDSILNQTYKNIEIIFVNDGSTDNTESIVEEYKKKFCEHNIIMQYVKQKNKGVGGAINTGLKLIRGEFFTWVGTDDFLHNEFIDKLKAFLDNNDDIALVRNDGFIVEEDNKNNIIGKMSDGVGPFDSNNIFMDSILERNFHFGYLMIRTSVFDETNELRDIYPSREGQNWQILLPIFYSYKTGYISEPLYYVVDNNSSVSRNGKKQFERSIVQQDEYKSILMNVIESIEIENKRDILNLIEIKYVSAKIKIGYSFGEREYVSRQYKLLKSLNGINSVDRRVYWRTKCSVLDKIMTFFTKYKTV